jgi:hypothetical protein
MPLDPATETLPYKLIWNRLTFLRCGSAMLIDPFLSQESRGPGKSGRKIVGAAS